MDEQIPGHASSKLITETLQLILAVFGIVVIGCLGWMLLMPMAVGLFFYFPCALVIDLVLRARNSPKR